jgi:type 1 fimbriae regulatory protein FimB/type 1 fimbriae regulatory protein FimE
MTTAKILTLPTRPELAARTERAKVRRTLPQIPGRENPHLLPDEAMRLIEAIHDHSRNPTRDELIVRLMWDHGLRVSELIQLRWRHVEQETKRAAILAITRSKGGRPGRQQILRETAAVLRGWQEERFGDEQPDPDSFLIVSEQGRKLTNAVRSSYSTDPGDDREQRTIREYETRISAATIRAMLKTASRRAGLAFVVRPHMLRHSAGTRMMRAGADIRVVQQALGHRSINSTMIYASPSDEQVNQAVAAASLPAVKQRSRKSR